MGSTGTQPNSNGTTANAGPSVADIQILNWKLEGRSLDTYVIGELKNNASVPLGVQLQATLRNKAGEVVDSADWWPASTRNIPAGATEPIKFPVSHRDDVDKGSLQVIAVKVWND